MGCLNGRDGLRLRTAQAAIGVSDVKVGLIHLIDGGGSAVGAIG